MNAVEVVRAGALTTVQDLGRHGWAHLGVPRGGALDEPAHRLANRLVGNPAGAATLETTASGVAVHPRAGVLAAVTGAPAPVAVDGRPAAWGAPVLVPAGGVLEVGRAVAGVRCYLAFAGGIAVPPVLGSRSTDVLSGTGPAVLADGDVLPLGPPHRPGRAPGPAMGPDTAIDPVGRVDPGADGEAGWLPPLLPAPPRELVLPVLLGPRHDWFTPAALRTLASGRFRVATASNRIALRTEGPRLERAVSGELPSEGLVLGAVQVPPDGQPVVFLADHPTTGGYPVIGVVPPERLAQAAQAAPGTPVRFAPASAPVKPRLAVRSPRSPRPAPATAAH